MMKAPPVPEGSREGSREGSAESGGETQDTRDAHPVCHVCFALLNAASAMQLHCEHHRDSALRASLETIHELARQAKAPWLACDAIRLLDDIDGLSEGERLRRCERLDHGIGVFCVGRLLSQRRAGGVGEDSAG